MAHFDPAFEWMVKKEGIRDNHRFDPGGETVWGISRVHRPKAWIWKVYDELIAQGDSPQSAAMEESVKTEAKGWYEDKIWDEIHGDDMESQLVANYVFGASVNFHPVTISRWMQEGLNALNNRQKRWPDIGEDGYIGPQTIEVLNKCHELGLDEELVALIMAEKLVHRKRQARGKERKEIFVPGWIRRDLTEGGFLEHLSKHGV